MEPAPSDFMKFRKLLFLQDAYRVKLADGSGIHEACDGSAGDDDRCGDEEPYRIHRQIRLRDTERGKADGHHRVIQ